MAFGHLDGGWQSYIHYVKVAADDGDEEMKAVLDHFESLSKARQQQITPEQLCLESGVNIKTFIGSVLPWIWIYSQSASAVVKAALDPAIVIKTGQAALGSGKNAHKDRETFLKMTGSLPTAQGSRTTINNMPTQNTQVNQGSSGLPVRLPSASQDMLELEAADTESEDASDAP